MSNRAIVAAAGSGKTEALVKLALEAPPSERVLLTTYTDSNAAEIRTRFREKCGRTPPNVVIMPWFTFLIHHCVRPYQHPTLRINEVQGLHFEKRLGMPPRSDVRRYYLTSNAKLYRDHVSEFVLDLNRRAENAVLSRLSQVFRHILVDEIQDLSGRDLDFVKLILESTITTVLVGDPRQGTLSTTNTRTNRQYSKSKILIWLRKLERARLLEIEKLSHSHRCSPGICKFADDLYPLMPTTTSGNSVTTNHDGVYLVRTRDVREYARLFLPQLLVWDKNSERYSLTARNMGEVKGLEFNRVIVGLTDPMTKFVQSRSELAEGSLAKLYVAATRARQSVALILDKPKKCQLPFWEPPLLSREDSQLCLL